MRLELKPEHKTIGLLFSGGMDSSLLLYMLGKQYPRRRIMAFSAGCSYIDNRIHMKQVNDVFDRVTNLVPQGALDYHITHYHEDRDTHHCNQAMTEFDSMVDVWVTGLNHAPPPGVVVTNCYGEDIDLHEYCHMENRKSRGEEWQTVDGYQYYSPLINLNKQDIVALYKRFGIYAELMPLTRSCPKQWDYEDMKLYTPECGWCYFCLERKWGLMK